MKRFIQLLLFLIIIIIAIFFYKEYFPNKDDKIKEKNISDITTNNSKNNVIKNLK